MQDKLVIRFFKFTETFKPRYWCGDIYYEKTNIGADGRDFFNSRCYC